MNFLLTFLSQFSLHALQNQQNNSQEETFEIRIPCTLDLFSFSSRLLLQHTKTSNKTLTKQQEAKQPNQSLWPGCTPATAFMNSLFDVWDNRAQGEMRPKQQRSANTSHSISIATQNKEHKEMLPLQTSTQQTQTERHGLRGRLEELSVSQSKVLFKVCGRVNWMTVAAISIVSTHMFYAAFMLHHHNHVKHLKSLSKPITTHIHCFGPKSSFSRQQSVSVHYSAADCLAKGGPDVRIG